MLPDPYPIQPLDGPFQATIRPPGSKSLTNRALILAALAEGTSTLRGVLFSDDTQYMMAALRRIGFDLEIDETGRTVVVHGRGGRIPAESADLACGNSGTSIRFLTALCCLGRGTYTLDGIERMRQRPIGHLVDALRQLGAKIDYLGHEGCPPLRIAACGLAGGEVTVDGSISSQFMTALLQIGPCLEDRMVVQVEGALVSRSYVQMTVRLMQQVFGADCSFNSELTEIATRSAPYGAADYAIEPDASNASYFLAAAALCEYGEVTIPDLGDRPLQGDAMFVAVLQQMGAHGGVRGGATWCAHNGKLKAYQGPLNDMPDMAQTLAVVALFAEGETVIRDVGNLRVKETDRMAAIKNECEKLGATVTLDGDDIHITPPEGGVLRHADGTVIDDDHPVFIDTYDDHRMAMAFSIAGLRQAGVRINDPSCVNKTYPNYFDDLEKLRRAVASR